MKVKSDLGPDAAFSASGKFVAAARILGKKVAAGGGLLPAQSGNGLTLQNRNRIARNAAIRPASGMSNSTAGHGYSNAKVPPIPTSLPIDRPKPVRNPVDHLIDEPAPPFPSSSRKSVEATAKGLRNVAAAGQKEISSPTTFPEVPQFDGARPGILLAARGHGILAIRILMKEVRAISDKLSAHPAAVGGQVILPGVLPALYQHLILQEVPRETTVDMMNALCDRTTLT